MAVPTMLWKLASPYDAYISHVARLEEAIERIRFFSDKAAGYEAGLSGSTGGQGTEAAAARVARFRQQLGEAATSMSDQEFEDFVATLGGGGAADVEANRASTRSRLVHYQRGLEEYFGIAGHELSLLEKRGYNPSRGDVSRQLTENRLPSKTIEEYRRLLHELGTRVARKA